jgi:UDP-4-amino-4-deoxy-L-arabinose-oxoglutarate aminotransferase
MDAAETMSTTRRKRTEFLPFCRPSITDEDVAAVGAVLRSGWITSGPKVAQFEECFGTSVGCPNCVAVSSATAGMHLALHALGIGPGDEVVTPSLTWVSTVNLIVLSGAAPVFADVDRDTLMVTAETLRPCLTSRTKLIIPVHYAGAAVDLDPIYELANQRGIHVIEDAAHAVGTRYKGIPIGHRGTSIFSFHPIKNITTGEGGMVCSEDAQLAERIRRLRFHGLGLDAYRTMQGRSPQAEVLEPGFKYNLTDMGAALGLSQLARLEKINGRRRDLAMLYREKLSTLDLILPLVDPGYPFEHSWHLFIARLDVERAGLSRDRFMEELKQRNIGTGLHFRAVHAQKWYRNRPEFQKNPLPHTEWNSDRLCSLPLFPDMATADLDDVVDAIHDVLKQ